MPGLQHTYNDRLFLIISYVIYCSITFFGIVFHEPGRDEAQFWLMARDMNLPDMFSYLSVKGHPGLWHFLLFPLVKTGMPYFSMSVLHWLIGAGAVYLFLFYSPFSKTMKVLFVFSYYMVFLYIIEARNYNLTIAILFLIASVYNQRYNHRMLFSLLVFLLFNSNIHSFGAASALVFIYVMDANASGKIKQAAVPAFIMIVGAVLAFIQVLPSEHLHPNALIKTHILPPLNIDSIWTILTGIQHAFIPVLPEYEELKVTLLFLFFFLLLFILFLQKKSVFIFLMLSSLWLFYIFSAKYSAEWRHSGLLLIFIVFALWIDSFYRPAKNQYSERMIRYLNFSFIESAFKLFLGFCLAINVVFGLRSLQKEFLYSYSGAQETAKFIHTHFPAGTDIACYRSWRAAALSPYIPDINLWYVDREEYGSYDLYKKYEYHLSEQIIFDRINKKYRCGKPLLLLLNDSLPTEEIIKYNARLIFRNETLVWDTDEKFLLYEITIPCAEM
ncbi:MAG: hypothetical protein AABZ32_02220 [Bacteroidota bacterium]